MYIFLSLCLFLISVDLLFSYPLVFTSFLVPRVSLYFFYFLLFSFFSGAADEGLPRKRRKVRMKEKISFSFFSPFFLLGKKRARGAGSGRSQHARKAQPAVGIRLDFSTGSRGLFFCLLASSRKCATCSHRARASTRPPMFLPLSLEVFIQPDGIVPESAVLVRSFSLVFSYLCTQRCGTVCECRESLFSHPFSYETWWSRARSSNGKRES